jgi:hypothetical protein
MTGWGRGCVARWSGASCLDESVAGAIGAPTRLSGLPFSDFVPTSLFQKPKGEYSDKQVSAAIAECWEKGRGRSKKAGRESSFRVEGGGEESRRLKVEGRKLGETQEKRDSIAHERRERWGSGSLFAGRHVPSRERRGMAQRCRSKRERKNVGLLRSK